MNKVSLNLKQPTSINSTDPNDMQSISRRDFIHHVGILGTMVSVGCHEKAGGYRKEMAPEVPVAGTHATSITPSDMNDMAIITKDTGVDCIKTPAQIKGPYYFDPNLMRSDLRENRLGTEISLLITVKDLQRCEPLTDVLVELWHADALGIYSGYADQAQDTTGQTFLRGAQLTNSEGQARFTSIYPGWYPGRAVHVHFKISSPHHDPLISQFYFSDEISDAIYQSDPYKSRGHADTPRESDRFLQESADLASKLLMSVTLINEKYFGNLEVII
jgi:protocatechuate 3,4-dioxygenase beta subunit